MHPMKIAFLFLTTLKNSIFVFLYLFVLHFNDVSMFIKIARIIFCVFLISRLIAIIVEWWKTTYVLTNQSIDVSRGLFRKKYSRIPLERVQNIRWQTPFYFQPFQLTILLLETSATDDRASVKLVGIKRDEAKRIEQQLHDFKVAKTTDIPDFAQKDDESVQAEQREERIVHFNPTRKDVIKASFLSFSFLAFIPILVTLFKNMEDVVDIEEQAEGVFAYLTSSWISIIITIFLLVLIAITFGVVRTYLKYGKYEISSDEAHIYIESGVLSERAFTIRKENVQAVKITQNPLKKLLGLSEVILVSASRDDDEEAVNSLYPYLPSKRAQTLLEELLPEFQFTSDLQKLTKQALIVRMLRLPWSWLIATGLIIWLKPEWWFVSPILFIATYLSRFFNYRNTRFVFQQQFIQMKTGGLWSTVFVTNRKRVIEINMEQSLLQRKFGLSTITTYNRTKPYHAETLEDITIHHAKDFQNWYDQRREEIQIKST